MNGATRVCVLGLFLLLLVACGQYAVASLQPVDSGADADVRTLLDQRARAIQRAQTVARVVILRQVDTDAMGTIFRFTDDATTKEITVLAPTGVTSAPEWQVMTTSVSPLVGHVAADLPIPELLGGPTRVTDTSIRAWPSCREPSATLFVDGSTLVWRTFCTLPAGVVSGEIDARSGTFTADGSGPVALPPTATPLAAQ